MNTINVSKTTTVALLPETCVRGVKHIRAEAYSRRKRIGWIECQAHRQGKENNELEIGCLQVNEPWRGQGTGAQLIDLIVRTYGETYNMKLCARPLCASQTMNSKHLSGKAVDVAAYQGSVLVWDSAFYPIIAEAFRTASLELMIPIRWGGVWATLRADKTPQEQVKEYVESRKKLGKQSFFDWGHYELA